MKNKKCDMCGKTDFDFAHDMQSSCIKSATISPDVEDWVCLARCSSSDLRVPKQKSIIRKIVPDILTALRPSIFNVNSCLLIITPNACNLELKSVLNEGQEEIVTVRMGDNLGFKTCLIAQYISGSLYQSYVLDPTCDTSFFREEVLRRVRELRKNPPATL